jgi:hypothetical protein
MHATTSPKLIDQQPAAMAVLAAVVFAVGIALGAVMDLRVASTTSSIAAPDTSYDAVENARAQFGVTVPDTSYDAVEAARLQIFVTTDTSYDAVEATRLQIGVNAPVTKFGKSGYLSSVKNGEQVTQPERDGRYGAGHR